MQSKYFAYKGSFIGQPLNSAGFADLVRNVRTAMPDLEVVVDECICEGHKVVTSSTVMGTLATPLFGYRSEEHTSELQSLMRISYAVFCLKKKKTKYTDISYA